MFEFPPKLKSQALDLSLSLQRPNFLKCHYLFA
jgi:hypothetical protein